MKISIKLNSDISWSLITLVHNLPLKWSNFLNQVQSWRFLDNRIQLSFKIFPMPIIEDPLISLEKILDLRALVWKTLIPNPCQIHDQWLCQDPTSWRWSSWHLCEDKFFLTWNSQLEDESSIWAIFAHLGGCQIG